MEKNTTKEAEDESPIKSQIDQPTSVNEEQDGESDIESCTILLKEVDQVEKELESVISRMKSSLV